MKKGLAGHHLMRVRIKKRIFQRLREAASEESDRLSQYVTVSDIVRSACYDWLVKHDTLRSLEQMPSDLWRKQEEYALMVVTAPLL